MTDAWQPVACKEVPAGGQEGCGGHLLAGTRARGIREDASARPCWNIYSGNQKRANTDNSTQEGDVVKVTDMEEKDLTKRRAATTGAQKGGEQGEDRAQTPAKTDDGATTPQKKGVFSELSGTAVIASALAAATSFALQSKIGLAGSIIGVGVAAAASTIATQVYKGMLNASAEKIKDLSNQTIDLGGAPHAKHAGHVAAPVSATQTLARPAGLDGEPADAGRLRQGQMAPSTPGNGAHRHGGAAGRRAAIAVACVAVAAVLVYALVVSLATSGQGIHTTIEVTPQEEQTEGQAQEDTSQTTTGDSEEATDADGTDDDTENTQASDGDAATGDDTQSGTSATDASDSSGDTSETGGNGSDTQNGASSTTDGSGTGGETTGDGTGASATN